MANITLLSDLGLHDPSVAIVKGILMQRVKQPAIIDVTHDVLPYNHEQAAYLLGAGYRAFAKGTCQIVLFDIFYDKRPALILCEINGHYFLTPDNGILSLAFETDQLTGWICYELMKENTFQEWVAMAGTIAERLQHTPPQNLGFTERKLKNKWRSLAGNEKIVKCEAIYIDNFENVVINFTRQQYEKLAPGKQFKLNFIKYETIDRISINYNDVNRGNKLCRFNSNGYMEICVNGKKAASLFGLKIGSKFNEIQITFNDSEDSKNEFSG